MKKWIFLGTSVVIVAVLALLRTKSAQYFDYSERSAESLGSIKIPNDLLNPKNEEIKEDPAKPGNSTIINSPSISNMKAERSIEFNTLRKIYSPELLSEAGLTDNTQMQFIMAMIGRNEKYSKLRGTRNQYPKGSYRLLASLRNNVDQDFKNKLNSIMSPELAKQAYKLAESRAFINRMENIHANQLRDLDIPLDATQKLALIRAHYKIFKERNSTQNLSRRGAESFSPFLSNSGKFMSEIEKIVDAAQAEYFRHLPNQE